MTRPVLYTVNGTGVADPFGPGFAADIGRAISDRWTDVWAQFWGGPGNIFTWQPIGYPAAMFPMRPSIDAGKAELSRLISLQPAGTPIALAGYSQGAIVTGELWRDEILNPAGRHHHRLADVIGIMQFGDPIRCPGIAHGNTIAGLPQPGKLDDEVTGGIAGKNCLTPEQTPDFLLSCALDGDLYAAAPVGADPWTTPAEVGKIETAIYDLVLSLGVTSVLEIAEIIADAFNHPITTCIAMVQAIINGLTFAAAGTNAPHWHYDPFIPPIVDWLTTRVHTHQLAAA